MAEWVGSSADPSDYWSFDEKKYQWLLNEIQMLNVNNASSDETTVDDEQSCILSILKEGENPASPLECSTPRIADEAEAKTSKNEALSGGSSCCEIQAVDTGSAPVVSDVKNDETGEIETCPSPVGSNVKESIEHIEHPDKSDITAEDLPHQFSEIKDQASQNLEILQNENLDEYLTSFYMDDIYNDDSKSNERQIIKYTSEFLLSLRHSSNVSPPSCIPDELRYDENTSTHSSVDQRRPQKEIKVIKLGRALDAEVQLKTCSFAWRPNNSSKSESDTAQTVKKFRSILNKITPEKFEKLMSQINELEITTSDCLEKIIDTIFDTAVNDQTFSEIYAQICKRLEMRKVQDEGDEKRFRTLLLNRCQKAFMQNMNSAEQAEDQDLTEEEALKKKIKRLGNIRLIGELFKKEVLIERIIHDCIIRLFRIEEEIAIESGLLLLKIAGAKLDPTQVKIYVEMMHGWKSEKKWSSRIRFMIRDMLELEIPKWHSAANDDEGNGLSPSNSQEHLDHQSRPSTPVESARATMARPRSQTPRSGTLTPRTRSTEELNASRENLKITVKQRSTERLVISDGQTESEEGERYDDQDQTAISSSPKADILPLMSLSLKDRNSPQPLLSTENRKPQASRNLSEFPVDDFSERPSRKFLVSAPTKDESPSSSSGNRIASPASTTSRFVVMRGFGEKKASLSQENLSRSPSTRDDSYHARRSRQDDPSPHGRLSHFPERVEVRQLLPRGASPRLPRGGARTGSGRTSPVTRSPVTTRRNLKLQPIIRAVEKNNEDEALEVVATLSPRYHADFVFELINAAVELCFRTRRKIGQFLQTSIRRDILRPGNVRGGLKRFMEIAEDVEVDVPRLWFHLAQVCAPLTSDDQVFPLRYFEESCESIAATQKILSFAFEFVKEMCEVYGKDATLAYWESSHFAQKWVTESTLRGLME